MTATGTTIARPGQRSSDVVDGLRKTGSDIVGDVPWSTHFCQFYRTRQDLLDILVPYIRAGLESNEFCMWVTADNLSECDARKALRQAVPGFDDHVAKGQIEILPYTAWYLDGGKFDRHKVLSSWVERLDRATAMGFDGARVTGDTMWLEKSHWHDFTEYEESINHVIGGIQLLVLCTYSLDKCGASEIADVISNHEFALMKRDGQWSIIESAEYKKTKEALRQSEERYHSLFVGMTEGFALHEIICDDAGRPVDYRFIELNPAFEQLTGLRCDDVVGKTVRDVLPGIESEWIEMYGGVALTGEPVRFQSYSADIGKHFEVYAYSPAPRRFACLLSDVTERVEQERRREEFHQREHRIADTLQRALIPSQVCQIPGYEVAVEYQPVLHEAEVGGDFYDVFDMGNGRFGVLIGDVAGKGLAAAMRVSAARYAIRSYARLDCRPSRVLALANDALSCDDADDGGKMLTAFFAVVDTEARTLACAGGGHEPPVVCRADGSIEELPSNGIPLGIIGGFEYSESVLRLQPGDTMVMVTDGIVEARRNGVIWGKPAVVGYLARASADPPQALASGLVAAARAHAGGGLQDDAAVVVLRVQPGS